MLTLHRFDIDDFTFISSEIAQDVEGSDNGGEEKATPLKKKVSCV